MPLCVHVFIWNEIERSETSFSDYEIPSSLSLRENVRDYGKTSACIQFGGTVKLLVYVNIAGW